MSTTINWTNGNPTTFTNNDYINAGRPISVILGSGWVSIESDAFRDNGQSSGSIILQSIEIPNTVTNLTDFALRQCSVLHTITFSANSTLLTIGNSVFQGCVLLANIVLPATITSIGDTCFAQTFALVTLVIPNSVTTMGDGVFRSSVITTITLSNNLTSIGSHFFLYCSSLSSITIPDTVTSIGVWALSGCTSLTSITIPSLVATIGADAFTGTSITTVVMNNANVLFSAVFSGINSITSVTFDYTGIIEDNACSGRNNITSVTIGNNITSIGISSFNSCSGLTAITIPDSVTIINNNAFQSCGSMSNINFGVNSTLTTLGGSVFTNSGVQSFTLPNSVITINSSFYQMPALTTFSFGSNTNITTLGQQTFANCSSLTTISIPAQITILYSSVFRSCTSLTSVIFNGTSQLTHISNETFNGCINLVQITVPSTVTTIGSSAFKNCALTEITIPSTVTSVGTDAFTGTSIVTVVINSGNVLFSTIFSGINTITSVTFDYTGTIEDNACNGRTNLANVTIGNNITSIGISAFNGCSVLTAITIPVAITTIGSNAFTGTSIVTAIMNNGNVLFSTIFSGITTITSVTFDYIGIIEDNACSGRNIITSVTIGNTITSIGISAFNSCSGLTSITIPDSVTIINNNAFQSCGSMSNINFGVNSTLTTLGGSVFTNSGVQSFTLPNSVITINSSFYQMPALTTFSFGSNTNITTLGQQTFANCSSLTTISIPAQITILYSSVFRSCTSLTSVIFNGTSQLTYISNETFNGCINLVQITIPSTVTTIGSSAFKNCALTEITIPPAITTVGTGAFTGTPIVTAIINNGNVLFSTIFLGITTITSVTFDYTGAILENSCNGITNLTNVTIINGITGIGNNAFRGCINLTSITIPDSVVTIGQYSFIDSTILSSVSLGIGVSTIEDSAFRNLPLTTITIPAAVTNIGPNAFRNTNLTQVIFTGVSTLTTIDSYSFSECSDLTVFSIPESLLSIGQFSFNGSGLTNVIIPNTVNTIGANAFKNSSSLTQITVGNGVIFGNIGDNVCEGCILLSTIFLNSKVPASFFNLVTTITTATFNYNGNIVDNMCTGWPLTGGITIGSLITDIGNNAFQNAGLTSIILPDTITNIGTYAFHNTTSLASITLGNGIISIGDYAFNNSPFNTIIIPDTVTTIGSNAFQGTSLASVTFSGTSTIANINSYTFDSCASLLSFTIPNSVTTISQFAFANSGITTITINDQITSLGASAFQNSNLTTIVIGSGLNSISSSLFKNTNLTNITIPTTIISIGAYAFEDTTTLTTITFNSVSQVQNIGNNAFKNTSLNNLTIPNSVINIGAYSFQDITNLSVITIGSGLADIGVDAFSGLTNLINFSVDINNITYSSDNGILYNKNKTTLIQYPPGKTSSTYRVIYGVDTILTYAFKSSINLLTIYIPFTLITIGTNAFLNSSLTKVYIFATNSVIPAIAAPSTISPFYGVSTVSVIEYIPPIFYIPSCNINGTISSDATFSGYIESSPVSSSSLHDFTESNFNAGSISVNDLKNAFKIRTTMNISSDLLDSNNLVTGLDKNGGGFNAPVNGWTLGEVTYTELLSKAVFGSDHSADFFNNLGTIKLAFRTTMDNNIVALNNSTISGASLSMFNAMLYYAPERFCMNYNATISGAGLGTNIYSGITATQNNGGAGAIVEIITSEPSKISSISITTSATTPYVTGIPIIFSNGTFSATIVNANPIQLSYINGTLYNPSGTSLPFEPYDYIKLLFTVNHSASQVNSQRKIIPLGSNPYISLVEFIATE